ncbi:MAG: acyl-CoA dehydratase activase [Spirochaetaceae bacterium]|jgi:predicted CoA-substrate-specific enzyme activase|nr:acyl-CoA dehydratase activase [Spirochaetaceae bacterium]
MTLHLGLDIGSTTVKAVVMEPETKRLLFSGYRRHNANQAGIAYILLQEIFEKYPDADFYAAVCGSGGAPVAEAIGAHFVQEVVANAVAVRTFHPESRVAIELGGQDAKIVFFHKDERTGKLAASDMRMNGSCAGGTGAFIDEVATLLRIPTEQFESFAAQGGSVHDISGRCGVFAKTDIQPLLNQGALPEDIALSAFHAIAKQTIGGLAQGLAIKPPVIFEGGPLTFNPTLVRVFKERLELRDEDIIRPAQPEILIAHGAALAIDELFAERKRPFKLRPALNVLADYHKMNGQGASGALFFSSDKERHDYEEKHRLPPPPGYAPKKGETVRAYLGIDAGSTTTKFVLMDEAENLLDGFYSANQGEPLRVVKKALLDLKQKYDEAGAVLEIIGLGTTGYGELLFDKAFGADYHTVETVAHAEAVAKYVKDASFILDIGGQDMKAINISNGIVTNITVNEACSAGCGSFLENFAANLGIPVKEIAAAAFNSKNPAELGSRCTVFMNSAIITEQRNGRTANDICAGLCRSIVENVFTKVVRLSNLSGLGNNIVVQGGTFKNDAVLRAIEQYLDKEVIRSPYPGEMGAIGIALLTKKHIAEHGYTSPHGPTGGTRFVGLDRVAGFDYTQESNVRCGFCANNCNRTLLTFTYGGGTDFRETWVTGNRCERGEVIGSLDDAATREKVKRISGAMTATPDLLKERETLLFGDYPYEQVCEKRNVTIGIPRVLDFWRTMPFFTTFFKALGFDVVVSRKSTRKLYERALQSVASDTVCFPAKLTHGHIHDLAALKVDRIFFPQLHHIPSDNGDKNSVYTCPVLKGYPIVNKYSDDPERSWQIQFDTPVFHWFKNQDRNYQLCAYMRETFGIDPADTRQAIVFADEAFEKFRDDITERASHVIAETERAGKFAVVIAGRHYQFDELVNHEIAKYFTNVGIPVIPLDALPGIREVDLSKTMIDIINNNHARLLSGAILAAQHPALEYVEIYNFGCGHDALFTDEVTRIMHEIAGKAPLILKLDESDVAGPLRIRVRSFIETVEKRRRGLAGKNVVRELGEPYTTKWTKDQRRVKTLLVPNVSRAFCKIMSAVIRQQGVKAVALPIGGKEAMALGKKYVHNDSCFPAQMVIGEALLALKSGAYDPRDVVVGTGKTMCDCRLVNYMMLTRKALDDAGFPEVPVFSTDYADPKKLHPGFKFNKLTYARGLWCLVMSDILEELRHKIRPYEAQKGETDRLFEESIDSIADAMMKGGMQRAYLAYRKAISAFCGIEYDRSKPKPVVFITGEYLLTFHTGSNYEIERYLEENGMEVELPKMVDIYHNLMLFHTVSEIKDFHVRHSAYDTLYAILGDQYVNKTVSLMERAAKKHPLFEPSTRMKDMAKLTDHIIHHSMQSGEGFLMAADILLRAQKGVKSFVMLQPFGCLPNHVCGRGIIKKVKEERPDIHILPLDYDPDTSFANIENRLQMLIMNIQAEKAGEKSAKHQRTEAA